MDDQISRMKGPQRVRRRPAVVFGSADARGAVTAIEMLAELLAEDGAAGHGSYLELTLHADGAVSLQDDGRGIYFGDDDTVWQELFCQLYPGNAYEESPKRNIFEKPGRDWAEGDNLELYAVQCASVYMDVRVNRDGFAYQLRFEKGETVGTLHKCPSAEPRGTYFRVKPDPEVFSGASVSGSQLEAVAQALASRYPGLEIRFRRED